MALGARATDLARLTFGRSLVLVGIGLGTGVAAALFATEVLSGMLYGVAPNDLATFIVVPVLLGAGALGRLLVACAAGVAARSSQNITG